MIGNCLLLYIGKHDDTVWGELGSFILKSRLKNMQSNPVITSWQIRKRFMGTTPFGQWPIWDATVLSFFLFFFFLKDRFEIRLTRKQNLKKEFSVWGSMKWGSWNTLIDRNSRHFSYQENSKEMKRKKNLFGEKSWFHYQNFILRVSGYKVFRPKILELLPSRWHPVSAIYYPDVIGG